MVTLFSGPIKHWRETERDVSTDGNDVRSLKELIRDLAKEVDPRRVSELRKELRCAMEEDKKQNPTSEWSTK
jgi:hypothetical protein